MRSSILCFEDQEKTAPVWGRKGENIVTFKLKENTEGNGNVT